MDMHAGVPTGKSSPGLYDVSNNAYCVEPDGYAVSSSNWDFTYSYGDKIKIGILNEYT